ncbi:MAG: DUF3256 family protein [Muribaculaceae bacterium]|nr:DUF3256 family protein [Muribaculaceae bacterium]
MKTKLLSILLAIASVPAAWALTASQAFVDAPATVFPTIDRITRLDMIDYFNSGSKKPSKNSFKGDCRIISASDSQITFSTSDVSEVSLSLIPQKSDTIIMVITTLKTPDDDSSARFYNSRWEEINKGLFLVPQLNDWVKPESRTRIDELESIFPFMLARFTYEPESGILTLTNNVSNLLPEEATSWAGDALKTKLVYRWDGKKMVKLNNDGK